ncbi:hypothetical protein BH09SUM1_BH09SUM1_08460 [soil metagenome]
MPNGAMSDETAGAKIDTKVPSDLPDDPSISYNPQRARVTRAVEVGEFRERSVNETEIVFDLDVEPELPSTPDVEHLLPGANSFALNKIIGEGGYGEVWKARQLSLGRFVAIKRLRDDIRQQNVGSPEALKLLERTFQNEALVMGLLDHPNIVPIYDLTRDLEGRSQLGMKLVRGQQWNRLIAQDRTLPLNALLAKHLPILIQLSQAVAFAHAHGVVHRDLKPSQVMVGEFGEVLLMDWGLAMIYNMDFAKGAEADPAMLHRLSTGLTAHSPSGTVSFMAPEQTERTAINTGPWTDIYLLGGILYYLLTATPPHSAPDSQAAFVQAMNGDISPPSSDGEEPPRELLNLARKAMHRDRSARIASAKDFLNGIQDYVSGAGRQREAAELIARAKECIEKSSRDYRDLVENVAMVNRASSLWPDAPELSILSERVLADYARAALRNGDLVLAQVQADRLPPGETRTALLQETEQMRRYVSSQAIQKRLLVITTAILFAAALFAFYRIYDKAETGRLFERISKLRSDENALAEDMVRSISLPSTLSIDPDLDVSATAISDAEIDRLMVRRQQLRRERYSLEENSLVQHRLDAEPFPLLVAEANLLIVRGASADDYGKAFEIYSQAAASRPKFPEPLIGMAFAAYRRGNVTLAAKNLGEAARLTGERSGLKSPEYARVLAMTAEAYQHLDDSAEAYKKYYRQSLDILESNWADLSMRLASYYRKLGEYRKAGSYSRPVPPVVESYAGKRSLEYYAAFDEYVENEIQLGEYVVLEPVLRDALTDRQSDLPPDDPAIAKTMWYLARVLDRRGKRDDAVSTMKLVLAIREKHFGPNHAEVATTLNDLASIIFWRGKYSNDKNFFDKAVSESEPLFDRTLRIREKVFGASHPVVAETLRNLALVYWQQGRYDQAIALRNRANDINVETLEANHPAVGSQERDLAKEYRTLGRYTEAEKFLVQSRKARERAYGPDSFDVARVLQLHALLYNDESRYEEADALMQREYEITKKLVDQHLGKTSLGIAYRGDSAEGKGDYAGAEKFWRDAIDVLEKDEIKNDREYIDRRLAGMYYRTGRLYEAREEAKIALHNRLETLKIPDPQAALYFDNIADLCEILGLTEEARMLYLRNAEYSRAAFTDIHNNSLNSVQCYLDNRVRANAGPDLLTTRIALGAWLDETYSKRKETIPNVIYDKRGMGWLKADCDLAAALLELAPPATDAAHEFAHRAKMFADLAGLPADHPMRLEVIAPLMEKSGSGTRDAKTPDSFADLWPDRPMPLETKKFRDPYIGDWDWHPKQISSWDVDKLLQPSGAELQDKVVKILENLKAQY